MPEQRRVLDENYRRKDSECERRVKVVFESPEVDLRRRCAVYEKVYGELVAVIGQIPEVEGKSTLKRDVFKSFLDKIFIKGPSRRFSDQMYLCSVAAQNPGVPFWDLVRLSIFLSLVT